MDEHVITIMVVCAREPVPRHQSIFGYLTMFMLKRKKRKEKRGKRGEKRKEFRIF
jgi:hypothetical protein